MKNVKRLLQTIWSYFTGPVLILLVCMMFMLAMNWMVMQNLMMPKVDAQGFGAVSLGPLVGNCQSSPTLGFDVVNNDIYSCGNGHTWKTVEGAVASLGAQAALTNVTTAQALFTIPACTSSIVNSCLGPGVMNVPGRVLHIWGELMFSNGATTPAITISINMGATTVVSTVTAANANTNTNAPLLYFCVIQTAVTGTSGQDEAHCSVQEDTATAWASGSSVNSFLDGQAALSTAYDHTTANAMTVNIAATAALTSVTARHQLAEISF